jgi:NAD(P)-dependent dehydrogenase (short-subunit alcohol dehydrogenase family)
MTNAPACVTLFDAPYKALVVGAHGAIGQAFVQALVRDQNCKHVASISRSTHPGFDLRDEHAIAHWAQVCREEGPFQIIIDATGALMVEGVQPEKSLASLEHAQLMKNFEINAVGPILVLRHFSALLAAKGPTIYAKLSARVGSISDNKKGGWYGYRSAKAALNMLLQTAGIELQRKNPALQVVALQPGTVKSNLSRPFLASVPEFLEPDASVAGMLKALKNLKPKQGAHFIDYKGASIDW